MKRKKQIKKAVKRPNNKQIKVNKLSEAEQRKIYFEDEEARIKESNGQHREWIEYQKNEEHKKQREANERKAEGSQKQINKIKRVLKSYHIQESTANSIYSIIIKKRHSKKEAKEWKTFFNLFWPFDLFLPREESKKAPNQLSVPYKPKPFSDPYKKAFKNINLTRVQVTANGRSITFKYSDILDEFKRMFQGYADGEIRNAHVDAVFVKFKIQHDEYLKNTIREIYAKILEKETLVKRQLCLIIYDILELFNREPKPRKNNATTPLMHEEKYHLIHSHLKTKLSR